MLPHRVPSLAHYGWTLLVLLPLPVSSDSSTSCSCLSGGAIAGITIGVFIAVLLLLLAQLLILRTWGQRYLRLITENQRIPPDELRSANIDVEKIVPTTPQKTESSNAGISTEQPKPTIVPQPQAELTITPSLSEERYPVAHERQPALEQPSPAIPSLPKNEVTASAPPRTKKEYITHVENFVTDNISKFFDPKEDFVKNLAEKAAIQADVVTKEFGLRPEITPGVVKLAFYDFVILCDDSGSMNDDPQSMPTLQDTLRRVAHFATILEPNGISVRFLNYQGARGEFDDLKSAEEIERKIAKVPFDGGTRLGEVLADDIVQPMIIEKVSKGIFRKPLFVVIITDGQPSGEPPQTLQNTILRCKEFLARQAYQGTAAVFLLSHVGSSVEARSFLKALEHDKEIGDMVFCSTENLDKRLAVFQQNDDREYTAWLIELFLAALDKQTKQ